MDLLLFQGLPTVGGLLGLPVMANSLPKANRTIKSHRTHTRACRSHHTASASTWSRAAAPEHRLHRVQMQSATSLRQSSSWQLFNCNFPSPEPTRQAQKGINTSFSTGWAVGRWELAERVWGLSVHASTLSLHLHLLHHLQNGPLTSHKLFPLVWGLKGEHHAITTPPRGRKQYISGRTKFASFPSQPTSLCTKGGSHSLQRSSKIEDKWQRALWVISANPQFSLKRKRQQTTHSPSRHSGSTWLPVCCGEWCWFLQGEHTFLTTKLWILTCHRSFFSYCTCSIWTTYQKPCCYVSGRGLISFFPHWTSRSPPQKTKD